MTPKYPEGAIIVRATHEPRRKILGCAGSVRFLPHKYEIGEIVMFTVEQLEADGWTVEETRWVPKEGELWEFVRENGKVDMTEWSETDPYCLKMKEVGNCYEPGTGEAAASRILKAYRGEK